MTFKDHFSGHAREYAAFRPTYPDLLFERLACLTSGHRLAWDCATGSGQAAVGLAGRYARVVATDASEAQIAQAVPHERVDYRVAPAESCPLAAASADLVTIAQALHWVDEARFFEEAQRVLVSGGVCAAWGYDICTVGPAIDPIVEDLYGSTLRDYWPPERRIVEQRYRGLVFPFDEIAMPPMHLEREMSLEEFLGYVRTWSATRRYIERVGADPVEPRVLELTRAWGRPSRRRLVRWPLFFLVGRA